MKKENVMPGMDVILHPVSLRWYSHCMRLISPGGDVTVTGGSWMEVWPVRLTFLWLSESSGRSGGQLATPEPCWGDMARDSPSESPHLSLEQRQ